MRGKDGGAIEATQRGNVEEALESSRAIGWTGINRLKIPTTKPDLGLPVMSSPTGPGPSGQLAH